LLLLVGGAFGNVVVGPKYSSAFEIPASESASGFEVLAREFPNIGAGRQSGSIVFSSKDGMQDPKVSAAMQQMFEEASRLEGVTVVSPYSQAGSAQVNPSRTVAFATVNLDLALTQREMAEIGTKLARITPDVPGLTVEIGGQALAEFEPPKSELIGLGFAVIVLIFSFGSVLAMGLPIGVALFGVGVGVSGVALLSHITTVPDFSTTLGAMIGIAVGIDYALFIVTRFRENIAAGMPYHEATIAAMDTAGRAVLFAGVTVVISLLGMLLVGLEFISGLGIAAASTVLVTMLAALTLLPALLGYAQHRVNVTRWRGVISASFLAAALFGAGLSINWLLVGAPLALVTLLAGFAATPLRRELKPRSTKPLRDTLAYRWSRSVQHHPWRSVIAGFVVLFTLAAPVFSLRMGFSDEGNYAPDTTTRKAYDLLAEGFSPGFNGPFLLVLDDVASPDVLTRVASELRADSGVAYVAEPFSNQSGTAAMIQIIPNTAPQDAATEATVVRLRSDVLPAALARSGTSAYLTGQTAAAIDFTGFIASRLPVFIGAVLLLSFLLLMLVFRSILVPLKAVVMNVVSIAAAYGVVVAVFQWGWLGSLTGIEPAPIEPFAPMMMFAIVFGLSMDYEVFLLSRVKEEYDRTGDAKNSVADGLAATARVITAAALIMITVFGAFLLEDNRVIQLFGTGLAAAVLLDATLVRMLLVPATMELLGARNWWLPRWLDQILPRLDVEGQSHAIKQPSAIDKA
jgi:RND superfamily putative drug exporter